MITFDQERTLVPERGKTMAEHDKEGMPPELAAMIFGWVRPWNGSRHGGVDPDADTVAMELTSREVVVDFPTWVYAQAYRAPSGLQRLRLSININDYNADVLRHILDEIGFYAGYDSGPKIEERPR